MNSCGLGAGGLAGGGGGGQLPRRVCFGLFSGSLKPETSNYPKAEVSSL